MTKKDVGSKALYGTIAIGLAILLTQSKTAEGGSSASTSASALATVIASISISKNRDLVFGEAAPGDSAKTVAPAESASAEFSVTGQPNKSYSISLPGNIDMVKSGGSSSNPDQVISVSSFASNPSGSGNLGAGGSQTLNVGASRAAIRATQETGSYAGSFTLTVTYQ